MSHYADAVRKRQTPQVSPIPGRTDMVENSAGGYVWQVDVWTRLLRFLILGTQGGTYYIKERDLTLEGADAINAALDEDGIRVVDIIKDVSVQGRAVKQEPAIFALVLASLYGDLSGTPKASDPKFEKWEREAKIRQAAYDALPVVCRTGTMLFTWVDMRIKIGGSMNSYGAKRAVQNWYLEKDPDNLAYQVVKYRSRDVGGDHNPMTHDRLIRMAHPSGDNPKLNKVLEWVAAPEEGSRKTVSRTYPKSIVGFKKAQQAKTPLQTIAAVKQYRLPREALLTDHLNDPKVQETLLFEGGKFGMPITAMIRNLGNMTKSGLLTATSNATQHVNAMLANKDALTHGRVHPVTVLLAARTYATGRAIRGKGSWSPVPSIVDALDDAFYMAFGALEPTGQSRMVALDISASMWYNTGVANIPGFDCAEASAAMAMCSIRSGDPYEVVAFTDANRGYSYGYGQRSGSGSAVLSSPIAGLSVHALSPKQRLDDILRYMRDLSQYMGGTDCGLPMLYAEKCDREVDVFEIYSDMETWAGMGHPAERLQSYRKHFDRPAKLACVGMVPNMFTLADPSDPGMMDFVGFDTNTPQAISAFTRGDFDLDD